MKKSLIDAKGDLIAGSADNTVVRVPVGANGFVLKADSAQASGITWAASKYSHAFVSGDLLLGVDDHRCNTWIRFGVKDGASLRIWNDCWC